MSRGIRGFSHLRRHPVEILLLPLVVLVVMFVALPVKLYALVTMNKQGWLTRSETMVGGEGQNETSLSSAHLEPVTVRGVPQQTSRELAPEATR